MKRFLKLLQPHLVRPILQSCVLKIALGLCAVLLWSRFVLEKSRLSTVGMEQGFFFMAVYFFLWLWFQYLAFDGIRPLRNLFPEEENAHSPHTPYRLKDLINQRVTAFADLEDEEQIAAKLLSNAIAAVCFLALYAVFA